MEITKANTFEEALESVQGTKYKLITKYKKFLGSVLTMDDLSSAADLAIWNAWTTWDETQTKFNTHAYNMINWGLMDELNAMNSRFKVNAQTTYELSREEETYEKARLIGKTRDEDFNLENNLDGSAKAKRLFTRDVWNAYISYKTAKDRPIAMINESQFKTEEGDFSIFDTIGDDNKDLDLELMKLDMDKLPADKFMIAEMLMDGADIADVAKAMRMTKTALMKMYTSDEAKPVRGIRNRRKIAKMRGEIA